MAAFILTMVFSLILGGLSWLVLGTRFAFDEDDERNDLKNFAVYYLAAMPLCFVVVFFGIG